MEISLAYHELKAIEEGLKRLDGEPIIINNLLSLMYNYTKDSFHYSFFIGMTCVDEEMSGVVNQYVNSLVEGIFSPNKPRISCLGSMGRVVKTN